MAGSFAVSINAKDSASGTIDGINKRMASFNKSVERSQAPFKALTTNYQRLTSLTGADKIAGGLISVARAGFSAFQSVSRIVEPLSGIVGAASIAGMMRLATAWANFGTNLGNVANRAGLSAEQMHTLQGALAGVSASALSGGVTELHDNLKKAAFGGAPEFVRTLGALHIGLADVNAMSPAEQLHTFADAVRDLKDPTAQAAAAQGLFNGNYSRPFRGLA